MRRRDFFTLIGSAAAAWPLTIRAQQDKSLRNIGAFIAGADSDPEAQTFAEVFRQVLEALGWIDGKNIHLDYRWTSGDADQPQG
jgi:putative ABC transport system substrate-binding protein